jgi:hypothetical protein
MKQIETKFTQKGWDMRQVQREGSFAIYERSKDGKNHHYEVIRIKSHNGFPIPGTDETSEPAEYYPSDTSWGKDGFTIHDLGEARQKLQSLIQAESTKAP